MDRKDCQVVSLSDIIEKQIFILEKWNVNHRDDLSNPAVHEQFKENIQLIAILCNTMFQMHDRGGFK